MSDSSHMLSGKPENTTEVSLPWDELFRREGRLVELGRKAGSLRGMLVLWLKHTNGNWEVWALYLALAADVSCHKSLSLSVPVVNGRL